MTKKKTDAYKKSTRQNTAKTSRWVYDKVSWKGGTLLCPVPVVLIGSMDKKGRPNICTVAWAGTICSQPPMLSISLRPERYSYDLIQASGEFTVNIPSVDQIHATDYCGVVSGRDVDKFAETGMTPAPATAIKTPIVQECPISLECKTTKTMNLGSHTLFIAEIKAVQVTEALLTPAGRLALEKAGLAAYAHGGYYALGKKLGFFGYSVQKKKKAKR
ncbi:MAG: flavin reductase family protein [Candidatus Hydrogenedens sp.]|jgi:flavin reductase (DIM6/NTAB) family NADH-FMN oxidoreductase RutF|nr:flavin reductase family protein [Candidatus Hydrogenedens sp.]